MEKDKNTILPAPDAPLTGRHSGPRPLPGLTREAEEAKLKEIIGVAQENLVNAREGIRRMGSDIEELFESAEQEDKGTLILWNDSKIRLQDLKRSITRFEKARKKPYFGRIDFEDPTLSYPESYYVGRVGISRGTDEPLVIDWRAPIASSYYENKLGPCRYTVSSEGTFEIDLKRKRTYEIERDHLKDFYDSDVVANDDLLTRYLARNKKAVLNEIIATIQSEQNLIIRRSPKTNIIVQGCAGSGKTTVAMHRISYILYNYASEFRPEDFYIIGSNQILLNYITGVLPDLDVYGVSQMTMEQLFIRLLYEDWDPAVSAVRPLDKTDEESCLKGSPDWFRDLEAFCDQYEREQIPEQEIRLEKTGALLVGANLIRTYLKDNPLMSMQSKKLMLNEILMSGFENEVQGKNVSFPARELKELQKTYETWFGKDQWKGSVYELYNRFLEEQAAAGKAVRFPESRETGSGPDHIPAGANIAAASSEVPASGSSTLTFYDVYDLAALAYIYKRIKETDPIREASHVVIDEAQDFGMMAYSCLHYCLRNCTYTIMGDTSQNIHFGSGLNDWEDLRRLILTGTYDAFGLLKKSYRNTVEISDFATEILRHGDFPVYPVEPILRHGDPVRLENYRDVRSLFAAIRETLTGWQEKGYETIAVVCRDERETAKVTAELRKTMTVTCGTEAGAEFGSGIMVLPVDYTKGLEFDAVLLFNPSAQNYPQGDGNVKLLYVAATRALHELAILYRGHLTPLIAEPAPEGKHLQELSADTLTKAVEYEKKTYTQKELREQERVQGAREMSERNYYGPERITIKPEQLAPQKPTAGTGTEAVPASAAKYTGIGVKTVGCAGTKNMPATGNSPTISVTRYSASSSSTALSGIHAAASGAARRAVDPRTAVSGSDSKNPSPYKFGDMVSSPSALRPKGHARINNAIRWVKKSKAWVELASSYGILRLTPLTPEIIRVSFVKGSMSTVKPACWELPAQPGIRFNCRESGKLFELTTGKLTIRIEKANGAIRFLKPDLTPLLSEKPAEPRQLENGQVWMYFDWGKNEKLKAKGMLPTDLMDLTKKARYISHGGRSMRMPLVISDAGYALAVPAPSTVMCCAISMYGPYLYTEETDQLDYCFLYGGSTGRNIELYTEISKTLQTE